jgi:hypothetical protein
MSDRKTIAVPLEVAECPGCGILRDDLAQLRELESVVRDLLDAPNFIGVDERRGPEGCDIVYLDRRIAKKALSLLSKQAKP